MKSRRFNSSEMRRFIKFSIVGVIGFTIDTGALNAVSYTHLRAHET